MGPGARAKPLPLITEASPCVGYSATHGRNGGSDSDAEIKYPRILNLKPSAVAISRIVRATAHAGIVA